MDVKLKLSSKWKYYINFNIVIFKLQNIENIIFLNKIKLQNGNSFILVRGALKKSIMVENFQSFN